MEFPNPAEGFDAIFEVVDDEIILRMDDIKPEIVKQARQELTEEDTRIRREDEREHKHRQLIESMNTRPFWHYCEVCGKKSSLLQRRLWMRDGTTRHILEDLGYWGQEPVGIVL